MENSSKLCSFRKKVFFNKCCFFGRYGRKFRQLFFQGRKWAPHIFTFWALNRPFLGKKYAFFSQNTFWAILLPKNFWGQGTFFDVYTKKYWIFSKQKLIEFIAKNDLEFSKKVKTHFYEFSSKIIFEVFFLQNEFIDVKTSYSAILNGPIESLTIQWITENGQFSKKKIIINFITKFWIFFSQKLAIFGYSLNGQKTRSDHSK